MLKMNGRIKYKQMTEQMYHQTADLNASNLYFFSLHIFKKQTCPNLGLHNEN